MKKLNPACSSWAWLPRLPALEGRAARLWQPVKALGWGVIPLILSEGVANFAHTLGWRHCIKTDFRPRDCRVSFASPWRGSPSTI